MESLRWKKALLLVLVAVSALLPAAFVRYPEPEARLVVFKALAKLGSLAGGVLLFWQLLLGFRGHLGRLMRDHAWLISLHRALGQWGSLLILLHPVFISIYYLEAYGRNLYRFGIDPAFDLFVLAGILVLALLAVLVVTSVFLRRRLRFADWFYTHLSAYLLFAVMAAHSFALGQTVGGTALRYGWIALAVLAGLLALHRAAHALGAFHRRHVVTQVREVADEVTELTLRPAGRSLRPTIGDYVYVRRGRRERAHPYTVTRYDRETGELAVTVKALGPSSAELRQVRPGRPLLLDGPYGVFADEVFFTGHPVVMVAGGIGITPFIRLLEYLERHPEKESWLFYANDRLEDMAYREFLDGLKETRVIHVLAEEPGWEGEKGFVDLELLRSHLRGSLPEYRYFLCGPPPMLRSVRAALDDAGVPRERVHYELFSE